MKTNPINKPSTANRRRPTARGRGLHGWFTAGCRMLEVSRHPICLIVMLALLASGTTASAQRRGRNNDFGNNGGGNNGFGNFGGRNNRFGNNGGGANVPGPTDYAAFSGYISVRNIFNPDRFAPSQPRPTQTTTRIRPVGPAFSLVGIMSYEKGEFAFFDGNNDTLRKVLYATDTNRIAGYAVAEITHDAVQLQSADKKQTLQLKVGDVMRQNGDTWELDRQNALSTGMGGGVSPVPAALGNTAAPEAGSPPAAAPSPALQGNDILRRLMQQRQQELGNKPSGN